MAGCQRLSHLDLVRVCQDDREHGKHAWYTGVDVVLDLCQGRDDVGVGAVGVLVGIQLHGGQYASHRDERVPNH